MSEALSPLAPRFRGGHVTSRDVAALAGVSQSAVSRCFTPGASIAEETRSRVMRVAAELGYRPNAHARNLITGRSRIVGVVLAHLDNLFYPRFLQLLTEGLQGQGMQVMLFLADGSRQAELMEQMLNYRVDGIVLAATTLNADLARACTEAGIPVVLFNRVPASAPDRAFHSVQTDQVAGMRALTDVLIAAGHRRIAYLAGSLESSTNQAREQGCRQALAAAQMDLFAYGMGDYEEALARQVVMDWYWQDGQARPLHECPDAIVAADDRMALAVLDALRHDLRLVVPDQVSVVGFDDVPQAAWPAYQLTTCAQPLPEMVAAVLRLLTVQLEAGSGSVRPPKGRAELLTGQIQIRASSRCAA
jgi:DNA-binding LacI/PurR family transcriptional regulator